MKDDPTSQIYQLKVTLLGTDPPVWRRVLVPADLTLEQLHHVLQAAMGWSNSHLHDFRIGQELFEMPNSEFTFPDSQPAGDEHIARLSSLLDRIGSEAMYTYDPGDNWQHSIVLEKVLPPDPEQFYPVCVDGEFGVPPEDCGGVEEFHQLLKTLEDRYHPEYRQNRKWVGKDFDPDAFLVEEVNRRLSTRSAAAPGATLLK